MPTLKVRARIPAGREKYALVPRYELVDHIASGVVRFPQYVGMALSIDEKTGRGSYKPSGTVEVDDTIEHRQHVKDGELWPADEATARACGVAFDPSFGGDADTTPHAAA